MSLTIGKHIAATLRDYAPLVAKIGGTADKARIYPIIVPPTQEVPQFPYIIYASDGTTEDYTKDMALLGYGMRVQVSIDVVTKKYSELGALAELVRKAMAEGENAEYDDFVVTDQTLSVGNEDYDIQEDAFFVTLHYTFDTAYKDEEETE